jgi:hypothetical protein
MNYLERQLIPDTEFIINDNLIKISSPSTLYINSMCPDLKMNVSESKFLIKQIKELIKQDPNRLKVTNLNKVIVMLETLYPYYYKDYSKLVKSFRLQAHIARQVKERGIHYGTTDDQVLDSLINEFNRSRELIQHDGVYNGYTTIINRLEDIVENYNNSPEASFTYKF